jgi:hypothetical protein
MHRIDADAHVANLFSEGDPTVPRLPTRIDAAWLNSVQEELAQMVLAAGLSLIKGVVQLPAVTAFLGRAQSWTAKQTFATPSGATDTLIAASTASASAPAARVTATDTSTALEVGITQGVGVSVTGIVSGTGVLAACAGGTALAGETSGLGTGVRAQTSGAGPGLSAQTTGGATSSGAAVSASTSGGGYAIRVASTTAGKPPLRVVPQADATLVGVDEGAVWWSSTDHRLHVYDGTGEYRLPLLTYGAGARPGQIGDIAVDTTTHYIYIHDGVTAQQVYP